MPHMVPGAEITHYGTVHFKKGEFVRVSGSDNWIVHPIPSFDPPLYPALGMVQIEFKEKVEQPYTVLVSAYRLANTPFLSANYGDPDENGFVVHMWETIADRTLQNGHFSFAVLAAPAET
jgi:hypothetical protein